MYSLKIGVFALFVFVTLFGGISLQATVPQATDVAALSVRVYTQPYSYGYYEPYYSRPYYQRHYYYQQPYYYQPYWRPYHHDGWRGEGDWHSWHRGWHRW